MSEYYEKLEQLTDPFEIARTAEQMARETPGAMASDDVWQAFAVGTLAAVLARQNTELRDLKNLRKIT